MFQSALSWLIGKWQSVKPKQHKTLPRPKRLQSRHSNRKRPIKPHPERQLHRSVGTNRHRRNRWVLTPLGNCARWGSSRERSRPKTHQLNSQLSRRWTIYLADMLIPYMALAEGKSAFLTRTICEHIESNIWLMEKMLNVKFTIEKVNNLYRIEKS